MRRHAILIALMIALSLVVAACGGSESDGGSDGTPESTPETTPGEANFVPRPGNSELTVGPNRVAIAIEDANGDPVLDGPDTAVLIAFQGTDGEMGEAQEADFVEAIPGTTGFWVVRHTFEQAGEVPAVLSVTQDDASEDIDVIFNIMESGPSVNVGDPAPPTENPTLSTQPNIKQLTTDTEPDEAFYQITVTQALAAQKPFVVVFATPAFCQTALCGPVLDNVKVVQPEFVDNANFIHIEPYELDANGGLANGQLTASPSTEVWGLQFEPWIFVVGGDGVVTDRFEGSASPDELRESIQGALS